MGKKKYLRTNITHLMKVDGLNRKQLSILSGVSVMTIGNIEHGLTTNPTVDTVAKIAKAFNLKVEDILYVDFRKEV